MIDDLLDASRIEARQLTLDRSPVDLRAQLGEILEKSADVTAGHAARLAVKGGARRPGGPRADRADRHQPALQRCQHGRPEGHRGRGRRRAGQRARRGDQLGRRYPGGVLPHLFKRFGARPMPLRAASVAWVSASTSRSGLVEPTGQHLRREQPRRRDDIPLAAVRARYRASRRSVARRQPLSAPHRASLPPPPPPATPPEKRAFRRAHQSMAGGLVNRSSRSSQD